MNFNYLGVEFDDVTMDDGHKWSQICKSCSEKVSVSNKMISDPGSGICGVEGCGNEADYYIDFPDSLEIEFFTDRVMVKNLAHLKRLLADKGQFIFVEHQKVECIGQLRKGNVIQTNGLYSIRPDAMDSKESNWNQGKGSWMDYGKASLWEFKDGICSRYKDTKRSKEDLVFSFFVLPKTN